MGKTKTAGVRHPVLESYGTIRPADLLCSKCGEVVYHGSKKKDSADATLPKSIYACRCAYFSSSQLVLPLREEEWAREVKSIIGGSGGDGQAGADPLAAEAATINSMHEELLRVGMTMIERMIAIGEKLAGIKGGLPHGSWQQWMQEHLTFSPRTAQRYLLVFKHRDDPRLQEDPVDFLEEVRGRALAEPPGDPVSEANLESGPKMPFFRATLIARHNSARTSRY